MQQLLKIVRLLSPSPVCILFKIIRFVYCGNRCRCKSRWNVSSYLLFLLTVGNESNQGHFSKTVVAPNECVETNLAEVKSEIQPSPALPVSDTVMPINDEKEFDSFEPMITSTAIQSTRKFI